MAWEPDDLGERRLEKIIGDTLRVHFINLRAAPAQQVLSRFCTFCCATVKATFFFQKDLSLSGCMFRFKPYFTLSRIAVFCCTVSHSLLSAHRVSLSLIQRGARTSNSRCDKVKSSERGEYTNGKCVCAVLIVRKTVEGREGKGSY